MLFRSPDSKAASLSPELEAQLAVQKAQLAVQEGNLKDQEAKQAFEQAKQNTSKIEIYTEQSNSAAAVAESKDTVVRQGPEGVLIRSARKIPQLLSSNQKVLDSLMDIMLLARELFKIKKYPIYGDIDLVNKAIRIGFVGNSNKDDLVYRIYDHGGFVKWMMDNHGVKETKIIDDEINDRDMEYVALSYEQCENIVSRLKLIKESGLMFNTDQMNRQRAQYRGPGAKC